MTKGAQGKVKGNLRGRGCGRGGVAEVVWQMGGPKFQFLFVFKIYKKYFQKGCGRGGVAVGDNQKKVSQIFNVKQDAT